MNIYNLFIIISWLVFLIVWGIMATRTKRTVKRTLFTSQNIILRIITFLVMAAAVASGLTKDTYITANPTVKIIGVICCVLGVAFAIWARLHIGSNWGMPMSIKEKPELVTTGPYQYVRHPIYTGVLLAILGSALNAGVLWLIVFLAALFNFIFRARAEEKIMTREFPEQYPQYMQRTKMIILFIF
jgi:protein-S-isoprenylcysteine O-methyltransferase Ste14